MAEGFSKDDKSPNKTENLLDSLEDSTLLEHGLSASPMKSFNLDDALKMKEQVESMIFSHEAAMDDNFVLKETPKNPNSLDVRVREVMEKAFWDMLEEQLSEDPPNYKQAMILLQEIKIELFELLPQTNNSLKSTIEEVLDVDLIKQKLEHSTFDLKYYSDFIIDLLGQLCAPVRDEEIEKLKSVTNVVLLYKEIFKVIEIMKIDLANFKLKLVRPYLKQHSAEIELKKFMDILKIQFDNGIDGLFFTKLWLSDSFNATISKQKNLKTSFSSTSTQGTTSTTMPNDVTRPMNDSTVEDILKFLSTPSIGSTILNNAYVRLLTNSLQYPETLLVDMKRLNDLKDKFGTLILVSSVLVLSSASIGRPLDDAIKNKLKSQLFVLVENIPHGEIKEKSLGICDQIVTELNNWLMCQSASPMSEVVEKNLRGQLESLLDPNSPCDPVFKLMGQRLCNFILEVISKTKDIQVPRGYSLFTEELTTLVKSFSIMVAHNQAVFGNIYQGIIWDLIRKYQDKINNTHNVEVVMAGGASNDEDNNNNKNTSSNIDVKSDVSSAVDYNGSSVDS